MGLCFFISLILACATRYTVSDNYSELIRQSGSQNGSSRTTIFFLIDGFSVPLLQKEIRRKHIPEIQKYFLGPNQAITEAYSAFPSLTYTNLASLLSERPVHLSGALGNSLLNSENEVIRFESVLNRDFFARKLIGINIFHRLANKSQKTVSLDYGLGTEATVFTGIDGLKAGLAAGFKDYLYLDQKRIDSLKNILSENPTSAWPRFIFIHLIGVDFLSHQHGRDSLQVENYLKVLDRRLGKIFKILETAERQKYQVVSMLSADHGFAGGIKQHLCIEDIVHEADGKALILNEGRMAGIYTQKSFSEIQNKLLQKKGIEIVAYRESDEIFIQSNQLKVRVQLSATTNCVPESKAISIGKRGSICPESLDIQSQNLFYPHLLPNLIYYFQAAQHPNLIVIPVPTTAFNTIDVGFHGGPTVDETTTPLLLRNALPPKNKQALPIWQLLSFL